MVFYDINNNVAEMFAFTESVKFEGENIVIDSGDNLLSGSMLSVTLRVVVSRWLVLVLDL